MIEFGVPKLHKKKSKEQNFFKFGLEKTLKVW